MGGGPNAVGGELTLALLETLLENAPVGLGFVDADLRFLQTNDMLAAVLPEVDDALTTVLRQVIETGTAAADVDLVCGAALWTAHCFPVRDSPGGKPVGAGLVLRDITVDRQAAAEFDARARHLEAVAALGQSALISDDFDGVLHEAIAQVANILGLDFIHVLEHHREAGVFELRATHNSPIELGRTIPDDTTFQAGYALHNRTPVPVADLAGDRRFTPSPLIEGLDAAAALTVVVRGPGWPFGVINAYSRSPRVFHSEEIDFVQSMSNVLGTAAARHKIDTALRTERERLRLALDAGGMGDWEYDLEAGRVSWSEAVEHIYGVEPGTFEGTIEAYQALIHPADREGAAEIIEAALADAEAEGFTVEHRVVSPRGAVRWVRGKGRVIRDQSGTPTSIIGVTADITDQMESEYKQAMLLEAEQEARADAEAARDRLEFLAAASEVLASSLDYRDTLSRVAGLVVSRLADWCAIDVVEDDGPRFTTVAVAHVDPAKVAVAEELRTRYPPDQESDDGVAGVIRSGQPQLIAEITDEMVAAAAVDEEHLAALRELGLRSVLMVPLIARGRTLGVISLIAAESERVYSDTDLALAMDLARRAALAIDNAMLFQERSEVAEALQRSLLPPRRPEIPGMEVAVRYRPVGRGAEIGGDFYDIFEAALGMYAVVIGDVCGKGTAAAAVTGLARDTIRGVSIRETSPRRVLSVLNEVVLRRDDSSRFLTVAMARVDPPSTAGAAARLRVACSGHPLPMVMRADGSVHEAGRPSLLLGLFPEVNPEDVDMVLAPGDAIVFFTDGVIEEQGPNGMFGEERLLSLLQEIGPADAEVIAQTILDAVADWTPGPPQDDVAIVVLRVPPAL